MSILRTTRKMAFTATLVVFAVTIGRAQEPALTAASVEQSSQQPVPTLVRSQGTLPQHPAEKLQLRFSIYANETSRDPIWTEQQMVQLGPKGEYNILLGAGSAIGLPQSLFVAGEPRWLAIQLGEHEESRTLLTSVPYAMKSADADTLGGQPANSFVTREELAAKLRLTATALASQAVQPFATPTGGGTTGSIPLWTSATALGNSALTQTGTGTAAKIGIATTTPIATLDVAGTVNIRGNTKLANGIAATATTAVNSPTFLLGASSYSTATSAAVAQNFVWQVQAAGNNTATPTAKLGLLFGAGSAAPAATGLSIAPTGIITFAPKQTFPGIGAGTITGVTAGTGLKGGGTTGTVTLSVDTTKIPQLSTANAFTQGASFGGESVFTGSSTDWMLVVTNTSTQSKGTILGQANGNMVGIEGASPGGAALIGSTNTGTGVIAQSYGEGSAAYLWSQANTIPTAKVISAGQADGLQITTHNGNALTSASLNGYGGLFSNNSTYQATVYATNAGNGNAGSFNNNSATRVALAGVNASTSGVAIGTYGMTANGYGVYGTSTSGSGVYGISNSSAGVFGYSPNGFGGSFLNNNSSVPGLAGQTNSGDAAAVGTYGFASAGIGVSGKSTSGTGAYGTSASGSGVIGKSQSGYAVAGYSQTGAGVWGELGFSTVESGSVNAKAGVWGDAGDATSYTPIGVIGTADNGGAGFFANNSTGYYTLGAYNASGGSTHGFFKTFVASTPDGACGIGGVGDLTCTGQVKSIVTTASARQVETYSVQSSENWIEDYGSGTLQDGKAMIHLDPAFVDMANTGIEYHVFLTPKGDAQSLYITNETAEGFEVRESSHGTANIGFDYRIVAKRRGMELQRMTDVTEKLHAEMESARPKPRSTQPMGQPQSEATR